MKFRYARHTNRLNDIKEFYTTNLGFELLGEFTNHSAYDGIFIGKSNQDWHLEFTQTKENVEHNFDDDDILVFYPTNEGEFEEIKTNLKRKNITLLKAKNPYWQKNGICFEDPDGFKIVVVKF